jgi:hypothetical protein
LEEWYIDFQNKITVPAVAPVSKEYMLISLNITIAQYGDLGNTLADVEEPL